MYTIGELYRKFNLSRSTLLYYDSIGLLIPSSRTSSNYRLYSIEDFKKLEKICMYRETGMPLEDIRVLLDSLENTSDTIFQKHLFQLNDEIKKLEFQRKILVQMLKNKQIPQSTDPINKESFVMVLKNSGLDEQKMEKLHAEFEKSYPLAHQQFLEFLGISNEEILLIRDFSKKYPTAD